MKQVKNIGFIGCGVMGSAVIKGILNKGTVGPGNIWAYDIMSEKTDELNKEFGINIASDYSEICKSCNMIFMGVKPGDFNFLLNELKSLITAEHLVISMAAGITTGFIESAFDGNKTRVVRLMPNTPCLIGEGVVAISQGKHARPDDVKTVEQMVDALGISVNVEERYMDAVTALSGSGPGYVFLFLEAMTDGAVNIGINRRTAEKMAVQTLLGSARMAQLTGTSFTELKNSVTSPGGTTIAALKVLEDNAFRSTVINAIAAAARRAGELGGNKN